MSSLLSAKKIGRPKVDSEAVNVRMERPMLDALDAYVTAQPDPKPSRPEAIRFLLRDSLAGLGYLSADRMEPMPAAPSTSESADRYADADPNEAVMVSGVGPMILQRAVRKRVNWREHHGLGLVSVFRSVNKVPGVFDMRDLGRLAELERFR